MVYKPRDPAKRNAWYKLDRQRNPEKHRQYDQKAYEKKRSKKEKLVEHMGGCCAHCKGVFHISAYDMHHVNPDEKEIGISYLLFSSWEKILAEASKCILLCANCHRKLHFEDQEKKLWFLTGNT
jgi:predicted HNH restriction endonuclease